VLELDGHSLLYSPKGLIIWTTLKSNSSKITMNELTKLVLAEIQIDNLVELLKENEYENYLYSKLIPIKCEIERQKSHLI
jgi:hypothetical protein